MQTKETKEVLSLAAALIKAIDAAGRDGFQWSDFYHFVPAVPKVFPALEGIDKVDDEVKSWTEEDLEDVKTFVVSELDIPNDKVERFIEKGIQIVLDSVYLTKEIFENETAE